MQKSIISKEKLCNHYDDFRSNYDELLLMGDHLTIHEMNKRYILVEVFKCIKNLNPPFLNEIFKQNNTYHMNLRTNNTLTLPKTSTKTWGLHSFRYRGSRAWNSLPDDIKNETSLEKFKSLIKSMVLPCTCKLCC